MDYEAPALRLYDAEHLHYNGPGHVLPLSMTQGIPFVTATLTTLKGESVQARLAVDTGGGEALAF